MKTRLEVNNDSAQKFWEIKVNNLEHTVTYGRIGTAGQSKTKSFDDAEAALKDAEKLVKSKKKKGYLEVGGELGDPVSEDSAPTTLASTLGKDKPKKSKAATKSRANSSAKTKDVNTLVLAESKIRELRDIADSWEPVDLDTIAGRLENGDPLDKEMLEELITHWFSDKKLSSRGKKEIVNLIISYGAKKAVELVQKKENSTLYDFEISGKFFRYVCELSEVKTKVRIFKHLGESINISDSRVRSLPEELAAFQEITNVSLETAFFKEFPSVLFKLKNLKHINLYASKIEVVSPEINQLKHLESFNLSLNKLSDLPEEICELTELKDVSADNLPVDLGKLFKDFYKGKLPVDLRKVLLNLLLDKNERALEIATIEHLVHGLNSRIKIVRANALHCLHSKTDKDSNTLTDGSSIHFLGKINESIKKWTTRITKNGYTFSDSITADYVVLGENPGDINFTDISDRIYSEAALKNILDRIDTPYLQDKTVTSDQAEKNVADLLLSDDTRNQKLALEMMKSGGVSKDLIFPLFCAATLSNDTKIRKQANSLLETNTSPAMSRKLVDHPSFIKLAKSEKVYQYIASFGELEEINALDFAGQALSKTGKGYHYIFKHGNDEQIRSALSHLAKDNTLVLEDINEELPTLIAELTQLKEFTLQWSKLKTLPDELWTLNNLEILNLPINKLKEIPEALSSLKKLKVLNLSETPIRKLPKSINELKTLEELNLNETKLKTIPDELYELTSLKKLCLGDLFFSEKDKVNELKKLLPNCTISSF